MTAPFKMRNAFFVLVLMVPIVALALADDATL